MCNFGESFMDFEKGEMSEWFKEHAWKVCILQKGIAGSNPALSAKLKNELNQVKSNSKQSKKIKSSNQHF